MIAETDVPTGPCPVCGSVYAARQHMFIANTVQLVLVSEDAVIGATWQSDVTGEWLYGVPGGEPQIRASDLAGALHMLREYHEITCPLAHKETH